MKTQPILDDVLAHLESRLPEFSVELFPDDVANYFLAHPNGAVLIAYQASDFGKSQDVFHVNQPRTIRLGLTMLSRSQWGDYGALALCDLVREAIVGFQAMNCKKAAISNEQFLVEIGGIWQYEILIELPTQNVQHSSAQKI